MIGTCGIKATLFFEISGELDRVTTAIESQSNCSISSFQVFNFIYTVLLLHTTLVIPAVFQRPASFFSHSLYGVFKH